MILELRRSGCEEKDDYFRTVAEDEQSVALAPRLPSGVAQVGRSPERALLAGLDMN